MIALLNPHSLTVKNRFMPETMSLQLSERQSTATVTVGPEAPVISVSDWLKDETAPGNGIVWRVKTVEQQYDTNTRTIQLEHLINTLRDVLMFGEVQPKDIAGSNVTTVAASTTVRFILGKQSDWTLGTFGYSVSNPYNFNGDSLYDALETVSSSLDDSLWTYDFSSYPFKLSIRPYSDTVGCEMRMDRNIKTLKKTIDRSRMFTRFYPIGKDNLHISGSYVSKNESLYGTVSKVETDQSLDTEAKLRSWARARLAKHAEPSVTVTVSGLELSKATGEALDKFEIGTMCRVPLPEFTTTITERVTKLNWSDKVKDPESVTVTLANALEDVASIINNLNKTSGAGGSGGRAGAKNNEEKHAWLINESDHVGLLAEAVAGPGADKNWSRVSSIIADGEGLHARVTKTEKDVIQAEAKIEVNEKAITAEVSKRQSETSEMKSTIKQQADKISLVVQEKNGQNVVNAAKIVASVNSAGSSVVISANHVDLRGYVTMSQMQAAFADAQQIKVQQLTVSSYFQVGSFVASWQDETVVTGISYSNSQSRSFLYGTTSSPSGTYSGHIVSSYTTKHLYYLGR